MMRLFSLLMLLGLGACGNPSGPAPCDPPMFIDNTGECVSQPMFNRRR